MLLGERISGAWESADVVEPKYSELWEFRPSERSRGRLLGVPKSTPEHPAGAVLVTLSVLWEDGVLAELIAPFKIGMRWVFDGTEE
jgi:hypothetical protein